MVQLLGWSQQAIIFPTWDTLALTLIVLELFLQNSPKFSRWKPLPFWALESHHPLDVLTVHSVITCPQTH